MNTLTLAALSVAAVMVFGTSCSAQKIAVTAHRGFWNCEEAGYARNSVKALEMAQLHGFWGSEFDVQMTADNQLVVVHGPKVDGKIIWDHTLAEFADFRLENGEKMPTLDEYLTQGEKSDKTVLVFELKEQKTKGHEDYMVDQSVAALKAHGLYDPSRVIFISFSLNICERLAALCPGFTVQYLEDDLSPNELAAKGINGVDYSHKSLAKKPEWVREAKGNGMSVNCWTVNKKDDIQAMINLGVDCITTDNPLDARELLGKKEKTVK